MPYGGVGWVWGLDWQCFGVSILRFFEASYSEADLIGFTKINILNWLRVNLGEGKHLLQALSTQNQIDPTCKILFDYIVSILERLKFIIIL